MFLYLLSLWLLSQTTPIAHFSQTVPTADSSRTVPTADSSRTAPAPYSLQLKNVLLTTSDDGKSWIDVTGNLPGDAMPMNLWIDQKEYLIGTSDGLYIGNTGIHAIQWNHDTTVPKDITFFSQGAKGPYAISHWNGIYQRQTVSGPWVKISSIMKNKPFFTMMESSDGNLIAGCENGLYKSDDHGKSWNQVYDKGGINDIKEFNKVLLACSNRGLLRSSDGGASWDLVFTGTTTTFRTREIKEGIVALVEGQEFGGMKGPNEILLSKDHGLTWKPMFTSLPKSFKDVYDLVQLGDVFFACSNDGIYRSTDHGGTWEVVVNVPNDKAAMFKLFIRDKSLYALLAPGC